MQKVITSDRLSIYLRYAGDEEAWSQMNLPHEQAIFGDDPSGTWMMIKSAIQDVTLISRGLVSTDYKKKAIEELHDLCDRESFIILAKNIC